MTAACLWTYAARSYNHDHDCHAGAITVTDAAGAASGVEVGAGADRADCLTFAPA